MSRSLRLVPSLTCLPGNQDSCSTLEGTTCCGISSAADAAVMQQRRQLSVTIICSLAVASLEQ